VSVPPLLRVVYPRDLPHTDQTTSAETSQLCASPASLH